MGWVANILCVISLWRLGSKHRDSFLWTAAGEVLWIVHAGFLGLWDLAVICFVFAVLAIRSWVKWGNS